MRLLEYYMKGVMCRQYEIQRSEAALHVILEQGNIVVGDIQKHMELTAKLMRERNNIVNAVLLPPEDLENLLYHFKIYSPLRSNIFPM